MLALCGHICGFEQGRICGLPNRLRDRDDEEALNIERG